MRVLTFCCSCLLLAALCRTSTSLVTINGTYEQSCPPNATHCQILCIGKGKQACGHLSSDSTGVDGLNLTCPTTTACEYCELYCNGDSACQSATLNGELCAEVKVIFDGTNTDQGERILVNAPGNNGSLYVTTLDSGGDTLKEAEIRASNRLGGTNEIIADCIDSGTDEECQDLIIHAEDAQYVEINCLPGTDCTRTTVYCPDESDRDIACQLSCDDTDTCQLDIEVSGGAWDDVVSFVCTDTNCSSSSVSCGDNGACSISDTDVCDGGCQPTQMPSNEPSVVPTQLPSQEPSFEPSAVPSAVPSLDPSAVPSAVPSFEPTSVPVIEPTRVPTGLPTGLPTDVPSDEQEEDASTTTNEPNNNNNNNNNNNEDVAEQSTWRPVSVSTSETETGQDDEQSDGIATTGTTETDTQDEPDAQDGEASKAEDAIERTWNGMDSMTRIGVLAGIGGGVLLCCICIFCGIRLHHRRNMRKALEIQKRFRETTGRIKVVRYGHYGHVKSTTKSMTTVPSAASSVGFVTPGSVASGPDDDAVSLGTSPRPGLSAAMGAVSASSEIPPTPTNATHTDGEGADASQQPPPVVAGEGELGLVVDDGVQGTEGGNASDDQNGTLGPNGAQGKDEEEVVTGDKVTYGGFENKWQDEKLDEKKHGKEESIELGVALAELMKEKNRVRAKSMHQHDASDHRFEKLLEDNMLAIELKIDEIVDEMVNDKNGTTKEPLAPGEWI